MSFRVIFNRDSKSGADVWRPQVLQFYAHISGVRNPLMSPAGERASSHLCYNIFRDKDAFSF